MIGTIRVHKVLARILGAQNAEMWDTYQLKSVHSKYTIKQKHVTILPAENEE